MKNDPYEFKPLTIRRWKGPATVKWLLYSGLAGTFLKLGFKVVSRRSKARFTVRYIIK